MTYGGDDGGWLRRAFPKGFPGSGYSTPTMRVKMTDPRIIECAKALLQAQMDDRYDYWGQISDHQREAYVKGAAAVILKWLEQPPTAEMCDEGNEYDTARLASEVYAGMCVQARKEIGGDHG